MDFIWLDSYSLRICVFVITATITILIVHRKGGVDPDDDFINVAICVPLLVVTVFPAIALVRLLMPADAGMIHPVFGVILSVCCGILAGFCLGSKSLTIYVVTMVLITLGMEQFSAQKIQHTLLEMYTKQELAELTWSDKTEIYLRYKDRIEEIRKKRQLEKIDARIGTLEQQSTQE